MKSDMKTFIIALLCTCASFISTAQQVVASTGHTGAMTGYTVSWTLGEPVIETFSDAGYMVTQGQHQTRLVVTAADDISFPGINLMVFPNPATQKIFLKVKSENHHDLNYRINDIQGHELLRGDVVDTTCEISLAAIAPGIYLLTVSQKELIVQTFRVIKY